MSFDQAKEWIQGNADEMVELQAELTSRPAMGPENGGSGEWEKARFLENYLRRHGMDELEHYDCPDDRVPEGTRPNFVVNLPGHRDMPRVWVLSHLDVVPPGEPMADGSWKGWDSDPFAVRRVGGMLMGRGVSDNHQAVVSSVFAARALLENDIKPGSPVSLLFVADEETGSHKGLFHVLGEHGYVFSHDDAIIVPDWGKQDGSAIEVAEKSVLWLEFRVRGRQSHGSRPDLGINALRAGSWLVQRL
ncbi:MAG: hypothetical protein AMK73_09770, partial [Planctomycetes bacterium SM23_32]